MEWFDDLLLRYLASPSEQSQRGLWNSRVRYGGAMCLPNSPYFESHTVDAAPAAVFDALARTASTRYEVMAVPDSPFSVRIETSLSAWTWGERLTVRITERDGSSAIEMWGTAKLIRTVRTRNQVKSMMDWLVAAIDAELALGSDSDT